MDWVFAVHGNWLTSIMSGSELVVCWAENQFFSCVLWDEILKILIFGCIWLDGLVE